MLFPPSAWLAMLIAKTRPGLEFAFLDKRPIAVTYKSVVGNPGMTNLSAEGKKPEKQPNFAGIKERKNDVAFK
jgi:hypothetical protein